MSPSSGAVSIWAPLRIGLSGLSSISENAGCASTSARGGLAMAVTAAVGHLVGGLRLQAELGYFFAPPMYLAGSLSKLSLHPAEQK